MKFHFIYTIFLCKENGSLKTFLYDDQNFEIPPSSLQSVRITTRAITANTFSPFGVNWISGLEFERDDISLS